MNPGATDPISSGALAAPPRHLFISPHYDDIALSCGGTAALLARVGRVPEIAIVFGAAPDPAVPLTDFARRMHEGWGLSVGDVIAARRLEEAAAAESLGTRIGYLPFLDAIYRGERYIGDDALFGPPAADEASMREVIATALDLPARPDAETRIYVPLAIGGHVDHQHAFWAGVVLARRGWTVWCYEDLPYALRFEAVTSRLAAVGDMVEMAALVDVETIWETKIEAIMHYPSQLETIFGRVAAGASQLEINRVMRRYAATVGAGRVMERLWRLN